MRQRTVHALLSLILLAIIGGTLTASAQVTPFRQEVYEAIQRGLDRLGVIQDNNGGRVLYIGERSLEGLFALAFLDKPRSADPRDGYCGFIDLPATEQA